MTELPPSTGESLVGATLSGKYQLTRLLGAGGMGAVYEAVNTWTEGRVALKVMHAQPGGSAPDGEQAARFLREARAATRVAHPNIVRVLDVDRDAARGGVLFIVQEYLVGEDLRALLDRRGHLAPREALELVVPLLSALAAAHQQGVVHRDIKPENIFLCASAGEAGGATVPKLIDFGIAKVADDPSSLGLTRTGTMLGTPYYMSPEQARGERDIGAPTDVWAMGVVLFELLAGTRPFRGDNYNALLSEILTGEPLALRAAAPAVPASLAAVVMRAIARDRARRFGAARELLAALLACEAFAGEAWFGALRSAYPPPPTASPPSQRAPAAGASAPPDPAAHLADTTLRAPPPEVSSERASTLAAASLERPVREVAPRRGTRRLWGTGGLVAGALLAVASIAALGWMRAGPRSASEARLASPATTVATTSAPATPITARYRVTLRVTPSHAEITLDGVRQPPGGVFAREFARDGTAHRVEVHAERYVPAVINFTDAAPEERVDLAPLPVAAAETTTPATPQPAAAATAATTSSARSSGGVRPARATSRRDPARAAAPRAGAAAGAPPAEATTTRAPAAPVVSNGSRIIEN